MYKKIDIYLNKKYLCSTNQAKTCKQAVENVKKSGVVTIASVPFKTVIITEKDKLTAFYSK